MEAHKGPTSGEGMLKARRPKQGAKTPKNKQKNKGKPKKTKKTKESDEGETDWG